VSVGASQQVGAKRPRPPSPKDDPPDDVAGAALARRRTAAAASQETATEWRGRAPRPRRPGGDDTVEDAGAVEDDPLLQPVANPMAKVLRVLNTPSKPRRRSNWVDTALGTMARPAAAAASTTATPHSAAGTAAAAPASPSRTPSGGQAGVASPTGHPVKPTAVRPGTTVLTTAPGRLVRTASILNSAEWKHAATTGRATEFHVPAARTPDSAAAALTAPSLFSPALTPLSQNAPPPPAAAPAGRPDGPATAAAPPEWAVQLFHELDAQRTATSVIAGMVSRINAFLVRACQHKCRLSTKGWWLTKPRARSALRVAGC